MNPQIEIIPFSIVCGNGQFCSNYALRMSTKITFIGLAFANNMLFVCVILFALMP